MGGLRFGHTATLLRNGTVLVTGGEGDGLLASAELFDPGSGTWTATGGMNGVRSFHSATLLRDGRMLVAGGFTTLPSGAPGLLASAELFDSGSGTWTATGNMNGGRAEHTATLLPDGTVLVAGGNSGTGLLASAELFDSGSGTWTATGSMTEARYGHMATLLPDGRVLVTGGYDPSNNALASAELYDPSGGS